MAEAVTSLQNGNAPRTPQDPSVGKTFKVIPEDLLEEGKQRLAQGEYSHFADWLQIILIEGAAHE